MESFNTSVRLGCSPLSVLESPKSTPHVVVLAPTKGTVAVRVLNVRTKFILGFDAPEVLGVEAPLKNYRLVVPKQFGFYFITGAFQIKVDIFQRHFVLVTGHRIIIVAA